MKNTKKIIISLVVILGIFGIAIGGYTLVGKLAMPEEKEAEEPVIDVIVESVAKGVVNETRTLIGNVEPLYDVDLMPQVQGRIVSFQLMRRTDTDAASSGADTENAHLLIREMQGYKPVMTGGRPVVVTENTQVRKGDVLAVLDYEGLEADMKKAWADYRMAVRAEKEALREKKRWVELYEEGKGPATEQQRDKAVLDYDVAIEETKSKKSKYESSKWQYKQAFLKAPFDGVVSRVFTDVGSTAGPGTPVLRLIHLDKLKIIAYVPNRYIGEDKIREGLSDVEIFIEKGLKPINAKVNKIYAESDRSTRTNPIEIIIDNERSEDGSGFVIRGNMYAKVRFFVRSVEEVKIHSDAVVRINDDDFVFIVRDGKAVKTKVSLDIWDGGYVGINEGLEPGDIIVVGGQAKLKDGSRVKIVGEGAIVEPAYEN